MRYLIAFAAFTFGAGGQSPVSGTFAGTSPCGAAIRRMLAIPAQPESEVIRWELTLREGRYELRYDYGITAPGFHGIAKISGTGQRQGSFTQTKGTPDNPDAAVLELDGAPAMRRIGTGVLHVLDAGRALLTGDGGFSYSLNRKEEAETPVDMALANSAPDMSYRIAPLETGPDVYAVFEGRSPCHRIARQLEIPVHAGCTKAKWRLTLFQDARYRIEGTLYRRGAGEGTWSRQQGTFRLKSSSGVPAPVLLEGDNNVLFFLDRELRPMTGHLEFSYTLNRRETAGPRASR